MENQSKENGKRGKCEKDQNIKGKKGKERIGEMSSRENDKERRVRGEKERYSKYYCVARERERE